MLLDPDAVLRPCEEDLHQPHRTLPLAGRLVVEPSASGVGFGLLTDRDVQNTLPGPRHHAVDVEQVDRAPNQAPADPLRMFL